MRWKFWTKLLISLLLCSRCWCFSPHPFTTNTLAWPNTKPMPWVSLVKINSLEKQYAASHSDKGFACELVVLRPQKVEPTNRVKSRDF